MPESTRREFLQTTASVAVGIATSDVLRAAPSQDRAGSNQGRIFKANKGGEIGKDKAAMVARLQEYKQLGFDGIEGVAPGISDIPALNEAIEETGVPVHGVVDSVHWNQRLSDPDPKVREIGLNGLKQALEDCAQISTATAVLLVPGKVTGPNETHDDVWERSIVEIRKALPTASRLGKPILIENVWNGFCEDPQQFADYIDAIDSPWVGAYFDIGNCRKFGPAEDWIRTLGHRVVKLDVKDWGKENGFCRLGEGDVDWPEVRKALAAIRYTGWATREGNDKSLADTSALMNQLLDL